MTTRPTEGFDFVSTIIGGSTQSGGLLKFEVASLFVFRGTPHLLDTTKEINCKHEAVNSDPCKMYVANTNANICLKCEVGSNNEKWVFGSHSTSPSINCRGTGALTTFMNRPSFYYSHAWTKCPIGQYIDTSNGNCLTCDSSCAACSGGGSTQCTACDWKGTKILSGSNTCGTTCDTSNGKFMMYGNCISCAALGCNICPFNRCSSTTCAGNTIQVQNSCCDIAGNKFLSGSTCGSCDEDCSSCFKAGEDMCLGCQNGEALQYSTNTCIEDCNEI